MAKFDNECDLGVNFRSNLHFDKHITNKCANGIKIVEIYKDVSYSQRHLIIGIPTLQSIRLRAGMIQVHNILNGYEYIDTECFYTVDSDSYTHEHPFKLKKD